MDTESVVPAGGVPSVTNSCYPLTESDFRRLEELTNRVFDRIVTTAATPSAAANVCLPTDFADASVAGMHVLVNVSSEHLLDALRHYRHSKEQAPAGTSACFLVPQNVARRPEVAVLLKGMHLLRTLDAPGPSQTDESCPEAEPTANAVMQSWPVLAFYDAVGLQLNAMNGCGLSMTLQGIAVPGTVSHVPANISFDSGASACYISQAFVERAGLVVEPSTERVYLADGSESITLGVSSVHLRLQAFQGRVQCHVMELGPP